VENTSPSQAYIGLGSNLDNPALQIRNALRALAALPGTRLITNSGLYLSKPMVPPQGQIKQDDYCNAVAKIETRLGPYELLECLQKIEHAQHRLRNEHWGPRTIDLDILLFDDIQMSDERLTLPHPGLHLREFVLYPLHSIDRTLEIPGRGMLEELVQKCPKNELQYLGSIEGFEE
jgi:2-amino-4-hydroxy-6-hydroxymethyldihydropteridine diphosphokinase